VAGRRGRKTRVPDPSGAENLRAEIRRILAEVVRQVDDVIRQPYPTAKSLHRLHQELRRLRTALAVWEQLIGSVDQARLHPLVEQIRRLARLGGQVRDRDVTLGILEDVAELAKSDQEVEELRHYRARLEDDARTGRELLRAYLRSERHSLLFEHLSEVLGTKTRPGASSDLHKVLTSRHDEGHAKIVKAHRKARRRPSMNRMHRLRIQVRKFRQMSELASAVDPAHSPMLAKSLRRLQQDLGHLHDLDVLLSDLDPTLAESPWAAALNKQRRRGYKAIRKVLKRRRTSSVEAAAGAPAPTLPRGLPAAH
jgi:CHAD domain-containing protein